MTSWIVLTQSDQLETVGRRNRPIDDVVRQCNESRLHLGRHSVVTGQDVDGKVANKLLDCFRVSHVGRV